MSETVRPVLPIPPVPPVLARLRGVPSAVVAARRAVIPRRAAVTAACLQLLLLPLFAMLSAAQPYEAVWLKLAAATWLLWCWPLFRWARARRPWLGEEQARRRDAADRSAVAEELDRLNPAAPDIYRTAQHPEAHDARTLDALEILYAAWESRLQVPPMPTVFGSEGVRRNAGAVRRGSLILSAAFALLAVAAPSLLPKIFGAPGAVAIRMALPLKVWHEIPAPRLEPLAVRARIVRGDTLEVVVLTRHIPAGRPVHARIVSEKSEETRHTLVRNSAGDTAWFRFGPVRGDLQVRFTARGVSTRHYTVRIVVPPRLQTFSAVVTPPAYTRLPAETFQDFPPALAVLPGTRIAWKGETDRSVAVWSFQWERGENKSGRSGTEAGTHGSGSSPAYTRVVGEAGALRVLLADASEDGGARAAEGPWRIDLKADAPPVIALLAPVGEGELPRSLKVPLMFRATDDFGVARVRLHYAVRDAEESKAVEGARAGVLDVTAWRDARDGTGGGVWDAAVARPEAGEVVELYLEAEDNDAVSGRKSARSATVRLRLPSESEVRAAIAQSERNAATSLASALERERRIRMEESKADRPDRANAEAPPIAGEGEVRRILSDQPRQNLQEMKAQLDAEVRALKDLKDMKAAEPASGKQTPETVKSLEALRKEVEAMEKRVPSPEAARAPVAEQKRMLESLNRDQKALEKKLAESRPSEPAPSSAAPKDGKKRTSTERAEREEKDRRENRARLEEELQRNIKEQKDLQAYLQEKERTENAQQKRLEEAARNDEQMQKDVEKALEEVKEAMEKGLENGDLSPDILEKMDRVRELLEEVLDQDEKDRLQREAGDNRPDAQDLQKAVKQLLEKKDGMRQDLERAIKMLEAMREMRALKALSGDLREMEKDQRALASELGKDAPSEMPERAEEQKLLEKRMDDALKEMDRLSKTPSMKSMKKEEGRKARDAMKKTSEKLTPKNPDRAAAKASADLAAKHLEASAEQMEKMAASMEGGSDRAEIRAVLEETLEFTRWLTAEGGLAVPAPASWSPDAGSPGGSGAGAGPEAAGGAGSSRAAKWLAARMQRLAGKQPFETEVLRREAAALSAAADAVSVAATPAAAEAMRLHARNAARELLKWLNQPESSGGEDEGDGEGDSQFGGGETGESGKEGMSGRMRGISGKQMAANQLTQELLRSMLQQRQESGSSGGGNSSGGKPGGKPRGSSGGGSKPTDGSGGSGASGSGAGRNDGGGSEGGSESGSQGEDEGDGADEGGSQNGSTGAAANAQQQIAKALESLAESADDAGGAARKLRQLAAEARALERALRGERLDPGEIQKRQEQFKTRLLEAADAMEERGQQQERRAEAWTGGVRIPEKTGSLGIDSLATELKRRRAEARKLPLTPAQKQRVEWYYERLLGP